MLKWNVQADVPKKKQRDLFDETTPNPEDIGTETFPALKSWTHDSLTELLYIR